MINILTGDSRLILPTLTEKRFRCCCTSPPYYGLRNYGVPGEIGSEKTPEEYIANLVQVFRGVHRVMADDGTLWLNLGDSYARNGGTSAGGNRALMHLDDVQTRMTKVPDMQGLKEKDLLMIPARVAIALQMDGWYLRAQIPWVKRQAMPESVTDRPNTAVEYVYLLSKSERYYYDHVAVKVPAQSGPSDLKKMAERKQRIDAKHFATDSGKENAVSHRTNIGNKRAVGGTAKHQERLDRNGSGPSNHGDDIPTAMHRNWRNSDAFIDTLRGLLENESGDPLAFLVNPAKYRGAHFATWPAQLVRPMILAGSKPGDEVLDCFGGSGLTGRVALELGRRATLIELNPKNTEQCRERCETTVGLGI